MATRVLIDTNIFLEVLLDQKRAAICQAVLDERTEDVCLTDFALHSIGIDFVRLKRVDAYLQFVEDIVTQSEVLSLPIDQYTLLTRLTHIHRLDFDDSYQLAVAEYNGLEFITLDKDFRGVQSTTKITFLG